MRALAIAILLGACGSPPAPSDAGADAGRSARDGGTPDGGALLEVTAPALAILTPCPEGWEEREADGAPTTCEPFPTGLEACDEGALLTPGRGCERIGAACAGEFASDLPTDVAVWFVAPGGTGDGSRAAPFGTLDEALTAMGPGEVVALSQGTHVGNARVANGAQILGACAGGTVIDGTFAGIDVRGPGARVRGVTLTGDGYGLRAVLDEGASLVLEDVLVRDTGLNAVDVQGGAATLRGVLAQRTWAGLAFSGCAATLERVELRDVAGEVVTVSGGAVDGVDVLVRGGPEPGRSLFLFQLREAGQLTLRRAVVRERGSALSLVDGPGARLRLEDVELVGVTPDALDPHGLFALDGGELVLTRFHMPRAASLHVLAGGSGSSIAATDVVLTDGLGAPDGRGGGALELSDGASARLDRVFIARARTVALLVDDSTVDAADLVIRDTGPNGIGRLGRSLQVQNDGAFTGERVLVEGGHEAGVVAAARGAVILRDARIADVQERACVSTTCPGAGAGVGVGAYEGGLASLTRFEVTRSAFVGVQLSREGGVDLQDGVVRECPIGANTQVEGYELERLTRAVRYIDNGRNLDSMTLPVPDPALPGL